MKHRKLRIAWSVAWGIVAVLLIALWVRSYWRFDVVYCPASRPMLANSAFGVIKLDFENDAIMGWEPRLQWKSFPLDKSHVKRSWWWTSDGSITVVSFPIWPAILLSAFSIATSWTPWIRWPKRFSLRTLLIATALIAIGLGLIVWATT
jgi:hypothetical protein